MNRLFETGRRGDGEAGKFSTPPLLHSSIFPLFLSLLLIGLLAAPGARAQEADTTGPALPDLAPREFEIRGQLELSLPTLERQPLTGFASPYAAPPAPGSRPYIEEYRQTRVAPGALPGAAEAAPLPVLPPRATGVFQVAGGRYFSRAGAARLALPLSERETLTFRLDYRGSSGFTPFEDRPAVDTPFDALDADLGLYTHRGRFTAGLTLDGFLRSYTLYGARANPFQLGPEPTPRPDRRGFGGSGTLHLRFGGAVPVAFRATYAETHYALDRLENDDPWDTRSAERRLAFAADTRIAVTGRPLTADARVTLSGGEADGPLANDLTTVDGGIAYRLRSTPTYDLTIGARAMAVSSKADAALYPSPVVRLSWYPRRHLTIYAQNTPGLETHPLAELFRENPYLVPTPRTAPTIRLIDAETGAQLFAGRFQFSVRAGLRQMPRYLFFERQRTNGYAQGFTAARYGEARVLHAGATLSLRPDLSGLHASLGVSVRRGRLLEDDTVIPYFAPLRGQAFLSYALPGGRGLVQLTGTFIGARYADRDETVRVDPFLDLDAALTYNLTSSLGAVLRLENISFATERWRHYPQPPFVIMTGLRVRW